jgi:CHASE3 domain sensor protein
MSNSLTLRKFHDPVAIISAIPLAVVVLVGSMLSYRSYALLQQNTNLVVHTYQVLDATRDLLLAAEDAETGQRGFVITGDDSFLSPYIQASERTIPERLSAMETMLTDDSSQLERVRILRQLLGEKFEELRLTIQERRLRGFEASRIMVENQSGKKIMDEIRESVSEIDQGEQTLLSQRTLQLKSSQRRIVVVGVFTAILSIAMRLLVAVWRQRILKVGHIGPEEP